MKIRLVNNGVFTTIEDINETLTPPLDGFYWIDADVDDLMVICSRCSAFTTSRSKTASRKKNSVRSSKYTKTNISS